MRPHDSCSRFASRRRTPRRPFGVVVTRSRYRRRLTSSDNNRVGSRRAASWPPTPMIFSALPQGSGPEDQENRRDPLSTPASRASPEPRDRARRPGSLARWRRRAAHGASPEPPPCRIVLQSRTLPAPPVAPAGRRPRTTPGGEQATAAPAWGRCDGGGGQHPPSSCPRSQVSVGSFVPRNDLSLTRFFASRPKDGTT
jgi:hypothetical protein